MDNLDVLYNAQCPVCRREMDHYARVATARALPFCFEDLNDPSLLAIWGIDADTAAKRLHVRKDGKLYSGLPAFIVLWQSMPRYGWLAKCVSLPGVYHLADWSYDNVLAPLIYWLHRRRKATSTAP